jgi:hypothetical protein
MCDFETLKLVAKAKPRGPLTKKKKKKKKNAEQTWGSHST